MRNTKGTSTMNTRTYDFTAKEEQYRAMDEATLKAALKDAAEAKRVATENARAAAYSDPHLNTREGYYADDVATILKVLKERTERPSGRVRYDAKARWVHVSTDGGVTFALYAEAVGDVEAARIAEALNAAERG